MDRPLIDEAMLATASAWAMRSTCSRLAVGAVLAREGRVISTGYGAPSVMMATQLSTATPKFEPPQTLIGLLTSSSGDAARACAADATSATSTANEPTTARTATVRP